MVKWESEEIVHKLSLGRMRSHPIRWRKNRTFSRMKMSSIDRFLGVSDRSFEEVVIGQISARKEAK